MSDTDENVMYDSPTEFMHELAQSDGACVAQSVVPESDGTYVCACSCQRWEVVVSNCDEGLRLARKHTAFATARASS